MSLNLASILVAQGRFEELSRVVEGLASIGITDSDLRHPLATFRAAVLAGMGNREAALAELAPAHALDDLRTPERLFGLIRALGARRRIIADPRSETLLQLYEAVQQLIDRTGMVFLQSEIDIELAELARMAGDEEAWRSLLEGVRAVFVADGRALRVAEVDAALAG